eukprot:CAMPEP_0174235472 /NCGR_PEP_ID=MMETSP0417-20130205/4906_1 /TAXON_ID=242541 /ORGANISM="Mayorella sp, Strain BSH-02190019" /LENGTH=699 /DNA_ID=CAMNT_0015313981 /DNA_START=132 /DNA_END=2228 /DNA_ORIENTATION=-
MAFFGIGRRAQTLFLGLLLLWLFVLTVTVFWTPAYQTGSASSPPISDAVEAILPRARPNSNSPEFVHPETTAPTSSSTGRTAPRLPVSDINHNNNNRNNRDQQGIRIVDSDLVSSTRPGGASDPLLSPSTSSSSARLTQGGSQVGGGGGDDGGGVIGTVGDLQRGRWEKGDQLRSAQRSPDSQLLNLSQEILAKSSSSSVAVDMKKSTTPEAEVIELTSSTSGGHIPKQLSESTAVRAESTVSVSAGGQPRGTRRPSSASASSSISSPSTGTAATLSAASDPITTLPTTSPASTIPTSTLPSSSSSRTTSTPSSANAYLNAPELRAKQQEHHQEHIRTAEEQARKIREATDLGTLLPFENNERVLSRLLWKLTSPASLSDAERRLDHFLSTATFTGATSAHDAALQQRHGLAAQPLLAPFLAEVFAERERRAANAFRSGGETRHRASARQQQLSASTAAATSSTGWLAPNKQSSSSSFSSSSFSTSSSPSLPPALARQLEVQQFRLDLEEERWTKLRGSLLAALPQNRTFSVALFGGGSGRVAQHLAEHFPNAAVLSFETDPALLRLQALRMRQHPLPNLLSFRGAASPQLFRQLADLPQLFDYLLLCDLLPLVRQLLPHELQTALATALPLARHTVLELPPSDSPRMRKHRDYFRFWGDKPRNLLVAAAKQAQLTVLVDELSASARQWNAKLGVMLHA